MKKRNLMAGIFMGVAIAASIPLGINRSLVRMRDDAAGSYYYDKAGYSICDGLEERRAAVGSLITLAERYKEQNPELTSLIDELDYRLNASDMAWSEDNTFLEEARANAAMDVPAQALADELNRTELNEKDKKYPDQLIRQMKSEQDKIDRSSYNEEAAAYNQKISDLAPMALVKPMALFTKNPYRDGVVDSGAVEQAVEETGQSVEAVPGIESVEQYADNVAARAEEYADNVAENVESSVEGFVDGILDGIFG